MCEYCEADHCTNCINQYAYAMDVLCTPAGWPQISKSLFGGENGHKVMPLVSQTDYRA